MSKFDTLLGNVIDISDVLEDLESTTLEDILAEIK